MSYCHQRKRFSDVVAHYLGKIGSEAPPDSKPSVGDHKNVEFTFNFTLVDFMFYFEVLGQFLEDLAEKEKLESCLKAVLHLPVEYVPVNYFCPDVSENVPFVLFIYGDTPFL